MIKFRITSSPHANIEFKHYDFDADIGHWKKQAEIYNPNIKINLFIFFILSSFFKNNNSCSVYQSTNHIFISL